MSKYGGTANRNLTVLGGAGMTTTTWVATMTCQMMALTGSLTTVATVSGKETQTMTTDGLAK